MKFRRLGLRRLGVTSRHMALLGLGLLATSALVSAQTGAGPGPAPAGPEAPELRRQVVMSARTTPDSLTVGDRVALEVQVEAPAGYQIRFPEAVEPNGPIEFVNVTLDPPRASRTAAGRQTWLAHYTLAVFQVGDLVLPPWPVEVRADSLYTTASTDSIRLYVESVLTDSLAAADLRDIKPQTSLPVSPWPWIVAGAALLVAIALLVWWLRRRRRRRPLAPVVALAPQRAAHDVALEALRRLESERLPLDGKFEAHYIRLSEILRRYLEDGFAVPALEETTEEILFELDRHGFDRATLKQVGGLCAESDLVKFARHVPTVEDSMQSLGRVRDFVLATAARSAMASRSAAAESASSGNAPAATGTDPAGSANSPASVDGGQRA